MAVPNDEAFWLDWDFETQFQELSPHSDEQDELASPTARNGDFSKAKLGKIFKKYVFADDRDPVVLGPAVWSGEGASTEQVTVIRDEESGRLWFRSADRYLYGTLNGYHPLELPALMWFGTLAEIPDTTISAFPDRAVRRMVLLVREVIRNRRDWDLGSFVPFEAVMEKGRGLFVRTGFLMISVDSGERIRKGKTKGRLIDWRRVRLPRQRTR